MASNVTRFVTFWIFWASYTAESRREQHRQHPLCRTLGSRNDHQPTHFPSSYTCSGDDDSAVCTSLVMETPDGNARQEEPGGVTWWVYQGQRQHVSGASEDLSDEAWLDCTDHYACRRPPPDPANNLVGASPRRNNGRTDGRYARTEWMPIESTLSEAKGTTPRVPRSQESRGLNADGDHSSAGLAIAADRHGRVEDALFNPSQRGDSLVYAPNATCDDLWLSWPAMQERAIENGTVLVFDVMVSVGNLFVAFRTMIKFVRLLEIGLVLRWTRFPGFRKAFNPGEVDWSVDAQEVFRHLYPTNGGAKSTGLHLLKFRDFSMVLSDSQLELLALTLGVDETNAEALATHFQKELPDRFSRFMGRDGMWEPLRTNKALRVQPCTWNMLLSRSSSMMSSLEQHSPWGVVTGESGPRHQKAEYIAWHIRTPEGETATSYNPTVHTYVIQEPSSDVCPTYLVAMEDALQLAGSCHASLTSNVVDEMVYISSNSQQMAKDCTVDAAQHDIVMGHVDMGLNASDAHTAHSHHPLQTALGAFLDFLFLMDAAVIVRTKSSFSGTVTSIKELECHEKVYDSLPARKMLLCLPSDC